MALRSLKRMAERRSLQAAEAALNRVRGGRWTQKADCPAFERQQQRRQDRDDLGIVVRELTPIIEERLADAVRYDRECEEIARDAAKIERDHGAYSNAPGARIGESAAPKHDPSGELQAFKAEVQSAIETSPDGLTARQRVAALLAKEGVLAAFRSK